MKNVPKTLAKMIFLALNAFTRFLTLKISNKEMNDFMKKVKTPEESYLWIKGRRETTKKEAIVQKEGFLE